MLNSVMITPLLRLGGCTVSSVLGNIDKFQKIWWTSLPRILGFFCSSFSSSFAVCFVDQMQANLNLSYAPRAVFSTHGECRTQLTTRAFSDEGQEKHKVRFRDGAVWVYYERENKCMLRRLNFMMENTCVVQLTKELFWSTLRFFVMETAEENLVHVLFGSLGSCTVPLCTHFNVSCKLFLVPFQIQKTRKLSFYHIKLVPTRTGGQPRQ